jgi:hypothetical protein
MKSRRVALLIRGMSDRDLQGEFKKIVFLAETLPALVLIVHI